MVWLWIARMIALYGGSIAYWLARAASQGGSW